MICNDLKGDKVMTRHLRTPGLAFISGQLVYSVFFQFWVNVNKCTQTIQLHTTTRADRGQSSAHHNRDTASCMFVNNSITDFDALLCKNIYGFRKCVMILRMI